MGLLDRFRSKPAPEGVATEGGTSQDAHRTVGLDELIAGYELIDVDREHGIVYVSERGVGNVKLQDEDDQPSGAEAVAKGEISGSGETKWRRAVLGDYNRNLTGVKAIDQYREMRNDSVVRSTLRVAKTPILAARWFMEPASNDPLDREIASFIWRNLTRWMTLSWSQFLIDSLYMLDYGVWAWEKVFDFKVVDGERRVIWRKFAPRHPYEIVEFLYDDKGGPAGVMLEGEEEPVELPIWKALVFTYDKEAGDLWGHSVLRSAYKHWFYKENLFKIDAIQKERHGIGIPVVKLPPNFTPSDRTIAERIGINLRTNERAHVTLPPAWDVLFLKLEGQRVDALESAKHHSSLLYENVLANFMLDSNASQGSAQEQVFVRSARFTAEIIRDVMNHYAVPQLCNYNWPMDERPGYPELKVRRLGDERDWRTLSFAARNLIGAQAMWVDPELRAWFRNEMDMPPESEEAEPVVQYNRSAPQSGGKGSPQPPKVGSPRQPSGGAAGTGSSGSAGMDRSGG